MVAGKKGRGTEIVIVSFGRLLENFVAGKVGHRSWSLSGEQRKKLVDLPLVCINIQNVPIAFSRQGVVVGRNGGKKGCIHFLIMQIGIVKGEVKDHE